MYFSSIISNSEESRIHYIIDVNQNLLHFTEYQIEIFLNFIIADYYIQNKGYMVKFTNFTKLDYENYLIYQILMGQISFKY